MSTSSSRSVNPIQSGQTNGLSVKISAQARADTAYTQLARACIALADARIRYRQVVNELSKNKFVSEGEFHGWPCLDFIDLPFVVFYQSQLACKLPQAVTTFTHPDVQAPLWKLRPYDKKPVEGWILLPGSLNNDWQYFAGLALRLVRGNEEYNWAMDEVSLDFPQDAPEAPNEVMEAVGNASDSQSVDAEF